MNISPRLKLKPPVLGHYFFKIRFTIKAATSCFWHLVACVEDPCLVPLSAQHCANIAIRSSEPCLWALPSLTPCISAKTVEPCCWVQDHLKLYSSILRNNFSAFISNWECWVDEGLWAFLPSSTSFSSLTYMNILGKKEAADGKLHCREVRCAALSQISGAEEYHRSSLLKAF